VIDLAADEPAHRHVELEVHDVGLRAVAGYPIGECSFPGVWGWPAQMGPAVPANHETPRT
jgi:hypothetical protein